MLRTEGLSKSFGSLTVTRDVSIAVERGERRALIGPNGAGKTTLFNLLSGEMRPDRGRILFGTRDITRASADTRARAGIARSFQRNNLFPGLSVRDNLVLAAILSLGQGGVFWKSLDRHPAALARAEDVAAAVGVADWLDHAADSLAYGFQRQLEIGLALALDPVVLLLDEPTAGMSPEETTAMKGLIGALPRDLTVMIIEHDMAVVLDIADQVTVLDYGTVIFEGTPEEVRRSAAVAARYLGGVAPA